MFWSRRSSRRRRVWVSGSGGVEEAGGMGMVPWRRVGRTGTGTARWRGEIDRDWAWRGEGWGLGAGGGVDCARMS